MNDNDGGRRIRSDRPADRLPNWKALHAMGRSLMGTTKEYTSSIEIEGPEPGHMTSYRVTPKGRAEILKARDEQQELF